MNYLKASSYFQEDQGCLEQAIDVLFMVSYPLPGAVGQEKRSQLIPYQANIASIALY
jgi:hypothetical protein